MKIAASPKVSPVKIYRLAPEHADHGLPAVRRQAVNLHPTADDDEEAVGRGALLEEQGAFLVRPDALGSDQGLRDLLRHGREQGGRPYDLPVGRVHHGPTPCDFLLGETPPRRLPKVKNFRSRCL
jgi:hypothetical protein